ncbi:MAG: NAD(P)H-dependent oxidoreductase [Betaproteobacteria bacterium]|nr:NAD(P)H-dependent oxidoreductase [Betaproteobacteria bacterium]
MAEPVLNILGISGSLRKASYNTAALRACASLLPSGMKLSFADIGDLPMYNQDVFDSGIPAPVRRFEAELRAADAVLIASPEYNFSIPPVLKNAIDWVSKLPNQPWQDKPAAIFSASQGPMGGARVQYDLRKVLGQLWCHILPKPEVFIGAAQTKIDARGQITDETTRKFLTDLLAGFKPWILRMKAKA